MDYENYIEKVAKSKIEFHKERAKMPFEEKYKIIIELQKLDIEMAKINPIRRSDRNFRIVFPEI